MKRRIITIIAAIVLTVSCLLMFAGCMPFDVPELITIEASQTAFLIPLTGDTNAQASFDSEAKLAECKIATKEVQIPHRFLQTGRGANNGKWIPTMKLIVVERKPETREWTEDGTGTSAVNQGIGAESKESIGFMARMNCSAQIDEADAVKFLYRYNSKPLSEIMDTEIRARIESNFSETCAKYTMEEILLKKSDIMEMIRKDVIPFFKDRGITINIIGLKGDFDYYNPEIQKAIDERFSSLQRIVSQKNENDRVVSKAEADAQAKIKAAEGDAQAALVKAKAEAESNRLLAQSLANNNLIQYFLIKQWNGTMPYIYGANAGLLLDPTKLPQPAQ